MTKTHKRTGATQIQTKEATATNGNLSTETDPKPTIQSFLFAQQFQGEMKTKEKQKTHVEIMKNACKTEKALKYKGMIDGIIYQESKLKPDAIENIEDRVSIVRHIGVRSTSFQVIFRAQIHHKISELG